MEKEIIIEAKGISEEPLGSRVAYKHGWMKIAQRKNASIRDIYYAYLAITRSNPHTKQQ